MTEADFYLGLVAVLSVGIYAINDWQAAQYEAAQNHQASRVYLRHKLWKRIAFAILMIDFIACLFVH